MDETESYLSKVHDKKLEIWSDTTKSIQRQAGSPVKLSPLRASPKKSSKDTPEGNKFVRKAEYLINVSRDKKAFKDRGSSTPEEKYTGSLYEAFADEEVNRLENQLTLPKRDAKVIWAKIKESDIVPCVPDIFLKIACTDDCAPLGSRYIRRVLLKFLAVINSINSMRNE